MDLSYVVKNLFSLLRNFRKVCILTHLFEDAKNSLCKYLYLEFCIDE